MTANTSPPGYREVTAPNGRVYRVGEDPREILGRSRSYMVWLPWVAMMAAARPRQRHRPQPHRVGL